MIDARPSPAIRIAGLGKQFPGVVALDDVTFDVQAGAITAVMGENGAGKSTLMTILAGLQRPDRGTVAVNGAPVETFTPYHLVHRHRVALVPQELTLCRERSVAENVMMGLEPRFPTRRSLAAATGALLDRVGTEIDPRARTGELTLAEQQRVLIARALARDCDILILDEPSTSLTPREVDQLFVMLRALRDDGATVVYVSHRLPEIFGLTDQIEVLRDGRHVASYRTDEVDGDDLVAAIVGRRIEQRATDADRELGPAVLEVRGLSSPPLVHDVSLTARAGEIVGIAGLPDSGRGEVVAALFGARSHAGSVLVDGRPVRLGSPRRAIAAGIGYVPAERRSQGLFPDLDARENAMILDAAALGRFGLLRRSAVRAAGARRLREFDVRGSAAVTITGLSGGNQQKVILSRWLARSPRVLLLDDPTRGVDVAAKAEIHQRLADAARRGTAIVMASSDLPELLRTCDRIVVLHQGRVAGELDRAEATERAVMSLATNLHATTRPGDDQ